MISYSGSASAHILKRLDRSGILRHRHADTRSSRRLESFSMRKADIFSVKIGHTIDAQNIRFIFERR